MNQFKILTSAVGLFKEINNGEDEMKLRLHHVKLHNEVELFEYTIFEFENNGLFYVGGNTVALEHARNCTYEILLKGKK